MHGVVYVLKASNAPGSLLILAPVPQWAVCLAANGHMRVPQGFLGTCIIAVPHWFEQDC